jgi:hypothetical protein
LFAQQGKHAGSWYPRYGVEFVCELCQSESVNEQRGRVKMMNRYVINVAIGMLFVGAVAAEQIGYTFENLDNIAGAEATIVYTAPDANTFGDGITVSVVDLEESDDNYGRIAILNGGDSVEAGVCDRAIAHVISFDVTIERGATVDFTDINFDTAYGSAFRLSTDFDWTFYTVVGGATNNVMTGAYQCPANAYVTENSGDIALTGLTGLSDTTVTFAWALNGQRNNTWGNLSMGVDDIVLNGTITRETLSLISLTTH